MAVGNIIGVGIMTMTGIAIGFIGRSVNIASIVVSVLSLVVLIVSSTQTQLIGNAAILGVAFILALWRGRKAKLSASYKER